MFKKLVLTILAAAGYTQAAAGEKLGYKTRANFASAISGDGIKLYTLANICKLCKCDLIIKNSNGITISVLDYIQQHGGADHPGSE